MMISTLSAVGLFLLAAAAFAVGSARAVDRVLPARNERVERIARNPVGPAALVGPAGQPTAPDPPLILIGSLPAGEAFPGGRKNKLVDRLATGALALWQARVNAPTVMVFTSPEHNSGEDWYVSSISKVANQIDVEIDGFTDADDRLRNMRTREVRLFSLGEFETGGYQLHIRLRRFFKDPSTSPRYVLKEAQTGGTSFAVVATDDIASGRVADITLRAPVVMEKDLKHVELAPDERQLLWQPLTPVTAALFPRPISPLPIIKLFQVGTFDLQKWLNIQFKTIGHDLPALEPTGELDRVYAVVTSPLQFNSGEFMTVREVFWRQNQATLRIDIWRDDGARKSNAPEFPLLVIPLELPLIQRAGAMVSVAGQYAAKAEFTLLRLPLRVAPIQSTRLRGSSRTRRWNSRSGSQNRIPRREFNGEFNRGWRGYRGFRKNSSAPSAKSAVDCSPHWIVTHR